MAEQNNLKFNATAATPRWRGHQDQNRTVSFNAFNGVVSLTIWDSTHRGGPVDSIPLTRELCKMLVEAFEGILKAQPNTNLTVQTQQYNKPQNGPGKWEMRALFKFTKDDKQIYSVEITTSKMNTPFKKIFRSAPFTLNTDELNESQRSALELKTFIDFLLKDVPIMRHNSTFNMTPPNYNNNRNNNSSSTPSTPPASTPSYTDNEPPY